MANPFKPSTKTEETPAKKRELAAMLKGAAIGSFAAVLVSTVLISTQPAKASATVLLPSLGTIINSITSYYNLMQQYVDQWLPDISGIFDRDILGTFPQEQRRVEGAMRSANEAHAGYHAQGDDAPVAAINLLNDLVRTSDGDIDMVAASKYLLPPLPSQNGNLTEDDLNQIRDHALILTQDQPIPPPDGWTQGTTLGTYAEYRRLNIVQQRLLSQDAITQYPLHSAAMNGYREYLDDVQQSTVTGNLTPGQLLSSQLSVMADVAVPVAMDSLESDLRRERLLGAQLATMANAFYEQEGQRLAEQGQ